MSIASHLLDSGDFVLSLAVSPEHDRATLASDLAAASAAAPATLDGPGLVQLWIEDVRDGDDVIAAAAGFTPYRDLLQLRCPLPAAPSGLITRAFKVGVDEDEFIRVNNRAFSWHPEQSGLTRERLGETMAEDWFDAEGFRLLELDDQLAGFCWTKVHPDHEPVLGEIYVIAVDPDFHGRGLGGPMTLAGLEHLSALGITESNLYVEADNVGARRVYDKLGYTVHSTNRAYNTSEAT